MVLFKYLLLGVLNLMTFQAYSQEFNNTISINAGNTVFPNWSPRTNSFSVGYARRLSEKWIIEGKATAAISNENFIYEPLKEFSYELVFYEEIQYRNLGILEVKAAYNIIKDKNEHIFLFVNCGLSFISGEEIIINSIWYGDFPESETSTNLRHHPGITGGLELLYYPLTKFGVGLYASGNTYTKYDPHFSFGANVNFRFGKAE